MPISISAFYLPRVTARTKSLLPLPPYDKTRYLGIRGIGLAFDLLLLS